MRANLPHMCAQIFSHERARCLFTARAFASSHTYYARAKITRAHPQVILRIDDVCVSWLRRDNDDRHGQIKHEKNRPLGLHDDDDLVIRVLSRESRLETRRIKSLVKLLRQHRGRGPLLPYKVDVAFYAAESRMSCLERESTDPQRLTHRRALVHYVNRAREDARRACTKRLHMWRQPACTLRTTAARPGYTHEAHHDARQGVMVLAARISGSAAQFG
jgi:hypothetical protein